MSTDNSRFGQGEQDNQTTQQSGQIGRTTQAPGKGAATQQQTGAQGHRDRNAMDDLRAPISGTSESAALTGDDTGCGCTGTPGKAKAPAKSGRANDTTDREDGDELDRE